LNPKCDLIVEIGIVELDLEIGVIKVIFDSLVKETGFNEKFRDSWIFENSDLTFEEVENAPALPEISQNLQAIFNKYHVTAFNKSFDLTFLRARNFEFKNELPCIMLTATNHVKKELYWKKDSEEYKYPKVEEAWNFFFPNTNYNETHRAADDAFHEAKILYKMFKLDYYQIF